MDQISKNLLSTINSVGRYGLALLFIVTALLKLFSPESSSALFQNFLPNTPASSLLLTVLLATCELFLGIMLLLSIKIHFAAILAVMFFLASTIIGVAFLNAPVDCGCFGSFIESKTDEFFLARNFLFLFLALSVLKGNLNKKTQEEGGML